MPHVELVVMRLVVAAKLVSAGFLLSAWLAWTWFAWVIVSLASVDEEWTGWEDVLLDPYIVGVYTSVSVVLLVPCFLLVRWARSR